MLIKNTKIFPKHTVISLAVFVFLMIITQFLAYQNHLLFKSKINNYLYTELDKLESSIFNILNAAESAMSTLSYVVQTDTSREKFNSICEVLLKTNPNLDALELVDSNGVIIAVNPLKGNETVIEYNILRDTLRNEEVLKAIKKKDVFYGGPFQLKQGGVAIVGRNPIFLDDGTFIGLTAVIIHINTLIKQVESQVTNKDIYFQFSKINPVTEKEVFFFPNREKLNKSKALSHFISEGDWRIYAQIADPLPYLANVTFPIIGLILSIIGSYLVKILLKQPMKLELMVEQKTNELFEHQKKYKNLLEHSTDAVLVINDAFNITFVSKSFENMFGYHESQTLKQSFDFFIHNEDIEFVKITLLETQKLAYSELNQVSFRIQTKANKTLWVEATFSNLCNQNEINGIVVNMHNITERVHYLEELQKQNIQLKEIAWTQSHIVRAPLVRIMSLIYLINEIEHEEIKNSELLGHIYDSAVELDKIIIEITKKAERLDFGHSNNSF